jgi:putative sigma-54 modulation protein
MNISFTFRNTDAEEWLKEYAEKKIAKIQKYIDKPIDAQCVLSVEKFRNVAEIKVSTKGMTLTGKEEAKEMIVAIDKVVDKIERQIKKYREKIRNHKEAPVKTEGMDSVDTSSYDEEDAKTKEPVVAETRRVVLKPMSIDDALMEMDELKTSFLLYRDLSSEEVRLIYRRDDGNYTLLEAMS